MPVDRTRACVSSFHSNLAPCPSSCRDIRLQQERQQAAAAAREENIASWDPAKDPNAEVRGCGTPRWRCRAAHRAEESRVVERGTKQTNPCAAPSCDNCRAQGQAASLAGCGTAAKVANPWPLEPQRAASMRPCRASSCCPVALQTQTHVRPPTCAPQGDPFKTLFISRLSYDVTERKLRREFEEYGPIKRIRLVHDKNSGAMGNKAVLLLALCHPPWRTLLLAALVPSSRHVLPLPYRHAP